MRTRTAFFLAAAGGAGLAAYRLALRPWWTAWGVDPVEAGCPLEGDDLVLAPDHVETRGIDIAAPPEAVWPWLVQMGYKRAGWYSYDRIDMDGGSATSIRPELQHVAVGDVLPTHPGGGFVVREVDPGRALVLYIDEEIIEAQAKAAKAAGAEAAPVNLQASGAFLSAATTPRFVASWAFVVRPAPGGSRLVERFRVVMQGGGAGTRALGPALGFGVFLMMRKQLLGIRERAERAALAVEPAAAIERAVTPPTEQPPEPAEEPATAVAAEEALATSPA